MFELSVQREFSAAHALVIKGRREPTHGHNWRVTAAVAGEKLDADGLLVDFHLIERKLDEIVGRFNNANLNELGPFDRVNPTAEHVVKHIADELVKSLPASVKLRRVSVTEAPGCAASVVFE